MGNISKAERIIKEGFRAGDKRARHVGRAFWMSEVGQGYFRRFIFIVLI